MNKIRTIKLKNAENIRIVSLKSDFPGSYKINCVEENRQCFMGGWRHTNFFHLPEME